MLAGHPLLSWSVPPRQQRMLMIGIFVAEVRLPLHAGPAIPVGCGSYTAARLCLSHEDISCCTHSPHALYCTPPRPDQSFQQATCSPVLEAISKAFFDLLQNTNQLLHGKPAH